MSSKSDERPSEGTGDVTSLPSCNAVHYTEPVFVEVEWSERGEYMRHRHGIAPEVADDALGDANRVVIDPDYNSTSGRSVRVIGYSVMVDEIITVIVLEDDGIEYGVNGWVANEKDRRIYSDEGREGRSDEQRA